MPKTSTERAKKWREAHPETQRARNYAYQKKYTAWKRVKNEFLNILLE